MTAAPGILTTGLPAGPGYLLGRSCRIELDRPRLMGVLNITPDSFSDGGRFLVVEAALAHARQMVAEGVDLIDVGGESTRPGAPPVSVQTETDRVLPVIEALRRDIDIPLSLDTTKSAVALAAVAAGAEFVNDISGLSFDPAMAAAVAAGGAGLFVMHTRGRPATMQTDTRYADLLGDLAVRLADLGGERHLAQAGFEGEAVQGAAAQDWMATALRWPYQVLNPLACFRRM